MIEKGSIGIILLLTAVSLNLLFTENTQAVTQMPRCAIIIVSDLEGFDPTEIEKAEQFYQYLLDEDYQDSDIHFLTENGRTGYDSNPNLTNIENAFSWLQNTSASSSQPVIYISDHIKYTLGNHSFQFSDGNISTSEIDGWLDQTTYQYLTMILGGNRSALAGPDLRGPSREVLCSMGSTQSFDEDLFNVTRGLKDPSVGLEPDE